MSKANRTSEHLRQFARNQPCTLRLAGICTDNGSHEATVMCHLSVWMKGIGMKVNDLFSIHACHSCHDAMDRRRGDVEVDKGDILNALCRTIELRMIAGLVQVKGMSN